MTFEICFKIIWGREWERVPWARLALCWKMLKLVEFIRFIFLFSLLLNMFEIFINKMFCIFMVETWKFQKSKRRKVQLSIIPSRRDNHYYQFTVYPACLLNNTLGILLWILFYNLLLSLKIVYFSLSLKILKHY